RFRIEEEGKKIEGVCLAEEDFPLCVRNARKDDVIRMRFGKKKLNRFFIDRKISYKEELSWPLMVNGNGEVIFVTGLGCDVNHYCDDPDVFMIKC
ncbi:MAG: tRNA lysidine(34) synthetase TilS, partial [Erysipelotrichaceae bacterium]|nr:tRNA lysidine(34) synthetase TilS [Erysipelotrichaceae bacterium]